jgi:hypothetical protein
MSVKLDIMREEGEAVESKRDRSYNPWPVFMFLSILVICITAIILFA